MAEKWLKTTIHKRSLSLKTQMSTNVGYIYIHTHTYIIYIYTSSEHLHNTHTHSHLLWPLSSLLIAGHIYWGSLIVYIPYLLQEAINICDTSLYDFQDSKLSIYNIYLSTSTSTGHGTLPMEHNKVLSWVQSELPLGVTICMQCIYFQLSLKLISGAGQTWYPPPPAARRTPRQAWYGPRAEVWDLSNL